MSDLVFRGLANASAGSKSMQELLSSILKQTSMVNAFLRFEQRTDVCPLLRVVQMYNLVKS
jgi:hypothetical protein